MGTLRRSLLISLVLALFVSQLTLADSECDFSYSNYALAVQMHDMGDYDRALKHYHCALEEDPDNGIIELLIDNVYDDIANAGSAWSLDPSASAPGGLVETPVEPPSVILEPIAEAPAVEPQAPPSSWTYAATAVVVERELTLAIDQRRTVILPVVTLWLESDEGDVTMPTQESLRYLRYDEVQGLRVYSWSRSTTVTEVAAETIGGGAVLWLQNRQRHESFQARSAWRAVAVSDVTESVNAALTEATGEERNGIAVMPGIYASATSLRMRQRSIGRGFGRPGQRTARAGTDGDQR